MVGSGGNGGSAGPSEDGNEGIEPLLTPGSTVPASLCDGEDVYRIDVSGSARVRLDYAPDTNGDLDLFASDASGRIVAAGMGVSGNEELHLGPGTYRITIRAYGPVTSTGQYTLTAE